MEVEQAVGVADRDAALPFDYEELLLELRRYVHRLTGDPDMADDIAQEAVMRFMHLSPGTAVASPRAWLYRAATNLVRDKARHEAMRRRKTLPIDADNWSTPEHDLERVEVIREVREALARIPERDRELLILRESGFRYREIAEVIGVKTESVPVIAARALERFRIAYMEGAGR